MEYFRIAKQPKRSKNNDRTKSTRINTHLPRTTSTIELDDKLSENDDHNSEKSTTKIIETSERMDDDEDDIEEIQPLSSITFTQQRISSINNPPPQSTDPLNSQPNLLSIRQNLQKGTS